jgi:hypothetical protein
LAKVQFAIEERINTMIFFDSVYLGFFKATPYMILVKFAGVK